MPSSMPKRSPASTFSAIGFNRGSVIVGSVIMNPSKISNTPNRCRGAPEHKEQHTNIAVHGEKRSVQLAQIIRFDKRMFVSQQRCDNGDSRPSWPWQSKAGRQPAEKGDHSYMHSARDEQRFGNPEFFGQREEPCAPVVINILACIEHVKPADPQRNRGAKNQHPRIERARNGDPSGCGRNAERKSQEKMRPACEALRERIKKQNGDGQGRKLQGKRVQLPRSGEKYRDRSK